MNTRETDKIRAGRKPALSLSNGPAPPVPVLGQMNAHDSNRTVAPATSRLGETKHAKAVLAMSRGTTKINGRRTALRDTQSLHHSKVSRDSIQPQAPAQRHIVEMAVHTNSALRWRLSQPLPQMIAPVIGRGIPLLGRGMANPDSLPGAKNERNRSVIAVAPGNVKVIADTSTIAAPAVQPIESGKTTQRIFNPSIQSMGRQQNNYLRAVEKDQLERAQQWNQW